MNRTDRWELKQLRDQLRMLKRDVAELRQGLDSRRWPALIRELRKLQDDKEALRQALRKVTTERDRLKTQPLLIPEVAP